MEKEIQKFEQKLISIRQEIKEKDFGGKSESGMLDSVMPDKEQVNDYLEEKIEELSALKNELVKDLPGDKTKLENELDERAQNFFKEMPFLLTLGKL